MDLFARNGRICNNDVRSSNCDNKKKTKKEKQKEIIKNTLLKERTYETIHGRNVVSMKKQ